MLAVAKLLTSLRVRIVPVLFLVLLPVMGAMGDSHPHVRVLASTCFAHVLTLLPLAQSVVLSEVPGLSEEQVRKCEGDRADVGALVDSGRV